METRVPARLTAAEGRRFAWTVGGAFLALAAIGVWRGRRIAPLVFAVLGGLFLITGLLVPSRLGPVYRGWLGFGHLLSKVTTPVFLGLVYLIVITPVGVLMRLFGRRPLERASGAPSWWIARDPAAYRRVGMEHQF